MSKEPVWATAAHAPNVKGDERDPICIEGRTKETQKQMRGVAISWIKGMIDCKQCRNYLVKHSQIANAIEAKRQLQVPGT